MIGTDVPELLWRPIASKRFDTDSDTWTLEGLDGDRDKLYRITVRHNNHAEERDNLRLTLNGDSDPSRYEAVEAYISADYSVADTPVFEALARRFSLFQRVREYVRKVTAHSSALRLFDPGWRVIRSRETQYMNFGKPLPGDNAVFGQGHLLAESGGPRSLLRQCAETHPNGHLHTIGRYTYTNPDDNITEMTFSSGRPNGIGEGSRITVEAFSADGVGPISPSDPLSDTE